MAINTSDIGMFSFHNTYKSKWFYCLHTDRHTDRHTDGHTDRYEYSIVVVDKPNL